MTVFSDNSATAWVVNLDPLKLVTPSIDKELNAAILSSFKTHQSQVNSVLLINRGNRISAEHIEIMTTPFGSGSVKNQTIFHQMRGKLLEKKNTN